MNRIVVLSSLVLFVGCATIPEPAATRIRAGESLYRCLMASSSNVALQRTCREDESVYCRRHGLDPKCGEDELWGRPGVNWHGQPH